MAWKSECGEWRKGDGGTPFLILPPSRMPDNFLILYKTFVKHGYTHEEINEVLVAKTMVDICWKEDRIRKMSNSEVRRAKKNLAEDWDEFLHSPCISGITISTLEEDEKIVTVQKIEKKERVLDIDPKDRIKMDTSDVSDAPLDIDFLEEMGIDESFLNGKKNG